MSSPGANRARRASVVHSRTELKALAPGQNVAMLSHERKATKATNIAREAALAFMNADADGNGVLDWEEFQEAIKSLRSGQPIGLGEQVELRSLFDSIDTDKSGTLDMGEYFIWTLDLASKNGCGLETIFAKYDVSGEGLLDANEFALAVVRKLVSPFSSLILPRSPSLSLSRSSMSSA